MAVFGSFYDLVDGVDTTAGENGSLDQSHDERWRGKEKFDRSVEEME